MVPILRTHTKKHFGKAGLRFEKNVSIDVHATYLQEAGHLVVPGDNGAVSLCFNLATLIIVVGNVPATQPGLSLSILQ